MNFLTDIIKEKVLLVETEMAQPNSLVPSYNEWILKDPSTNTESVNELYVYANLLEVLRKYQTRVMDNTAKVETPKKQGVRIQYLHTC